MSNNVYLRKYLLKSLCAIMFFIILLCLVNKVEYNKYKYNTNQKINGIVAKIQEKYPEIGKEEIIEILNSNNKDNVFNEYGYDINKDSYINQNNEVYIKFNILKIFILLLSFMILIYLFVRYYFKRDNEIEKIIKCLEKINQKNYEIDINDVSEDKLSILKHEIYKTTVMLKENTEKGNQDKINLKKSLQDISHQLKTPLTSSIIMLDNIIDDLENDIEIKPEFIKKVKKDISKISFLIQSILKLSMFESNTITFIRKEIPVKKIINSSIENIENLCDLKNIKIVVKDRSKNKIYCDYRWQVEAFSNIIISVILVWKFGIVGVAIGTLVAMLIRTVEFVYHTNKYILERKQSESTIRFGIIAIQLIVVALLSKLLPTYEFTNYLIWIKYACMVLILTLIVVLPINLIVYKKDVKDLLDIIKRNVFRKKETN